MPTTAIATTIPAPRCTIRFIAELVVVVGEGAPPELPLADDGEARDFAFDWKASKVLGPDSTALAAKTMP